MRPSNSAITIRSRYLGKGTRKAAENITEGISPALAGLDASDQTLIDRTMLSLDGTPNKAKLGANAILAVSMAAARASAESETTPLYRYIGGVKAYACCRSSDDERNQWRCPRDNSVDLSGFMIAPVGSNQIFGSFCAWVPRPFHTLKERLKKRRLLDGRR